MFVLYIDNAGPAVYNEENGRRSEHFKKQYHSYLTMFKKRFLTVEQNL